MDELWKALWSGLVVYCLFRVGQTLFAHVRWVKGCLISVFLLVSLAGLPLLHDFIIDL
jgi:hypothetical protein